MKFTTLTEAQIEEIRSVRRDWPATVDWSGARRGIDAVGQRYWEKSAESIRKRRSAAQRENAYSALLLTVRLRRAQAGLDEGALAGVPDPDLKLREKALQKWLSDYQVYSAPFAGRNNPLQRQLEWQLMRIWKGPLRGRLVYSRTLDGTPYGPLVDFLAIVFKAILGKALGPSGIAKMIDRHRKSSTRQRNRAAYPYQA